MLGRILYLAPAPMQRALVDAACSARSTVEAYIYPGLGHPGMVNRSFTDSRVFARHVIAGEVIAPLVVL